MEKEHDGVFRSIRQNPIQHRMTPMERELVVNELLRGTPEIDGPVTIPIKSTSKVSPAYTPEEQSELLIRIFQTIQVFDKEVQARRNNN